MSSMSKRITFHLALVLCGALIGMQARADSGAEQLSRYESQIGRSGQPEQGRLFFISKHGGEWSCASCHTENPKAEGKHARTDHVLDPMAPSMNPKRFTNAAKTEKWFKRSCNDVLSRECTPEEKADVLAWLITQ